ncbi:hypothetical protein ENUP19_0162G0041 [Entamoeba nuttalli]|uniref:Nucleoplasmin-like domain-containing protein n=2 Tax=Entamoeba nuttalli TaxID=412467 RepID=K2HT42_ENTNP|nr:hypothetical protein ENU1_134710 [Entamoeba nuttalli P19]EKE39285.1 hypothetical protein ENU1_134710 [Entamoeba nuttalli P19]|eukprot:XP_008858382.1 hypothetical protein ENU1_134710 [Entamoeba nuttalli P19]
MESFVVTKTGHHMDIPDGSYVKLLNFAYKGNKPSSVVLKVYNEKEEELRAILCTLTPEHPQYFAEIIVAGPSADFELIGDDEITVYMDIDFDDITKFEDDDDMTFDDMEDDEEEEDESPKKEVLKKEEKKPQPPKQEKKPQPKKESKQQQPQKKQLQENKKKNKNHGKKQH